MRRRLAAAGIVAVAALLALVLWNSAREKPMAGGGGIAGEAGSFARRDHGSLGGSPPTPAASVATPTPTPPLFAPPDEAAMIEVDKVSLMIRDYRSLTGENPVGTNAEIMAAVMGGNPKQAMLGPPEGMRLNEEGELIDRWNTPYFFHQLSKREMEIRSAGADKVMWTEDDAIAQ